MFHCSARGHVVQRVGFASTIALDQHRVMSHYTGFRRRLLFAIRFLCFATAALLLSIASSGRAQTTNWILPAGQSGDWSNPLNWDNGVPTSSINVAVANGGTATISQSGMVCQALDLGGTSSGAVVMTGGGLSSSGSQYIGFSGVGTFLQQGGGNSIYRGYTDGSSCLYLGYNVGSCGTYTLSGTAGLALESTTSSAIEYVGYSGSGTFIQTGGTNSVVSLDNFDGCYGYIYIGYNSGATGTYSLSSGSCSSDIQYVGYSGTGSFSQSGGTNTIYNLYLGYNTTSQGTYELSGSGTFNFLNRYVGYSGTGKFTQSGGTISGQPNEGDLYVGYNAGSCGTYELTGTGVIGPNYNYYEYVGYSGAWDIYTLWRQQHSGVLRLPLPRLLHYRHGGLSTEWGRRADIFRGIRR